MNLIKVIFVLMALLPLTSCSLSNEIDKMASNAYIMAQQSYILGCAQMYLHLAQTDSLSKIMSAEEVKQYCMSTIPKELKEKK